MNNNKNHNTVTEGAPKKTRAGRLSREEWVASAIATAAMAGHSPPATSRRKHKT